MKKILSVFFALLLFSSAVWAAGTMTETHQTFSSVKILTLTWVSHASTGNVTGSTTAAIDGVILRISFTPDSGGTQPTNLYDVVLYEYGTELDLLAGEGANLSNAAAMTISPRLLDKWNDPAGPPVVSGRLTYAITNAGNSKGGVITIYYR